MNSSLTIRTQGPVRQMFSRHLHVLPQTKTPGEPLAAGPLANLLHNKIRPIVKTGTGFRSLMVSPRKLGKLGAVKPRFTSRGSGSSGRPDSRMSDASDWEINGNQVSPMLR